MNNDLMTWLLGGSVGLIAVLIITVLILIIVLSEMYESANESYFDQKWLKQTEEKPKDQETDSSVNTQLAETSEPLETEQTINADSQETTERERFYSSESELELLKKAKAELDIQRAELEKEKLKVEGMKLKALNTESKILNKKFW